MVEVEQTRRRDRRLRQEVLQKAGAARHVVLGGFVTVTFAARASARAASLLPMSWIWSGVGPTNTMPSSAQACASARDSARKP
jgi:hypothetical protein